MTKDWLWLLSIIVALAWLVRHAMVTGYRNGVSDAIHRPHSFKVLAALDYFRNRKL